MALIELKELNKTYNNGYIYPGEPDRPYSHPNHAYLK